MRVSIFGLSLSDGYFQTWAFVCRFPKPVKVLIQRVCARLTEHHLSNTEWGYGGGQYVDRWCRWCNQLVKVPAERTPEKFRAHVFHATGVDVWQSEQRGDMGCDR